MVIQFILFLVYKFLSFFLSLLAVLLSPFLFTINFSYNLGLVFGNIWLLNNLLPISDLFAWFSVFVLLNFGLLVYKLFFLVLSYTSLLRRTVFTIKG